jgi:transposase
LFVAVLGASTYTFARATLSQDLGNWVECQVAAFEYCEGSPRLIVPMAAHYGVAVLPARPRKPRDKAKLENAVLLAERWVIAALRHRKFHALPDLNEAIAELLEKLNHRPFRKREGLRAGLFAELDSPRVIKPRLDGAGHC